ncbi:MAG TPA: branched-chain amino acid ABC transporter permease [bacterium]|nr:branched-chain amino acid ABC transporter permease [bacterium]
MRGLHIYILVAASVLSLVYGHLLNPYMMHVAIIAMIYGILAGSWSLLSGYIGLYSLGHMAFASVGGYTSALLVQWTGIPIPLGMAAGVALCCALGGLIGWVCLRMSGPYLAIFTLAFAEIIRITFSTEDQVTAGMAGLHTVPIFHTISRLPYFYTAFGLLVFSLAIMGGIVRSRWGLFFRAIREDEQAAAATGVNVALFRILAFAIASGFAGLAGGFYAHYIGILTPSLGALDLMVVVVVMTVIGGMERLPTAVGGAFGVEVLQEVLRAYGQWRLVLFGIILLLTMRFARNGLLTPLWLQFVRLGEVRGAPPVPRDVGREGSRV